MIPPAISDSSEGLDRGSVLLLASPEASEHLGEVLNVDAPAGRAIEAPDGVGAGLLRRPGSGAEVERSKRRTT